MIILGRLLILYDRATFYGKNLTTCISGAPLEVDDFKKLPVGKLKKGNYAKLTPKRKNFDCQMLFESNVHDLPAPTFMKKPFKEIPGSLKEDYTYDGRVVINSYYIDSNFPTNRTSSKLCLPSNSTE